MVSAEGLARDSQNTERLLHRAENEMLLGMQIFMPEASVVERSLAKLLAYYPSVIDINCGCPVPKVVKTGAGSALLREPGKIHAIVRTIKDACDTPVSVKIRLGWESSSINYLETTDAALSAGVDMITMHARTKAMGYSGTADWQALAELKTHVLKHAPRVPVFGSGDLFTSEAAVGMLKTTGVDGVMFARGAMGNPFIFSDTKRLLTEGTTTSVHGTAQRVEALLRQLHLMGADVGERLACREMRKHATLYLKGIPHASQAKQRLVQAATYAEYEDVCAQLVEEGL
jgi:nifR3 family TIM-barrel protein